MDRRSTLGWIAGGLLSAFLLLGLNTVKAQTVQRIKIAGITSSINTGQDYSPWLDDNLNNMVQDDWNPVNFQYVDVTLKLQQHSKITKLALYDWQGIFNDNPATIYALNGTTKTLLATFTGPNYMVFDSVKLAKAVDADAIIVHKYCNNIPQKIQVFGTTTTSTTTTPTPTPTPAPTPTPTPAPTTTTPALVKIPIDGSRWYQLNSASDGIASMFDGSTSTTVQREYGKMFQNYDAYYPVLPGEKIDLYKVRFYSNNASLGNNPLTLSVITSDNKRIVVGTFKGGLYNAWVGPTGGSGDANFLLSTAYKNIKYLVLNCWYDFPPEIELYGVYTAGPAAMAATKKSYKLSQYLGVNAFEWNFENPNGPGKIDTNLMRPARAFTLVRHYLDWQHLERTEKQYTFNPSPDGGWNYDALYQGLKNNNIDVLVDIKTLPDYMLATYPDSLKDSENVPVKYGSDFSNPNSYIQQARMAYQFAARYGSNSNVSNVSVAAISQYKGGPVNVSKKALGLVTYIECDNERDKWWKGRKAYQTAWEYAANLSAFYDGNKNTMGPGVGVKNADPNMKVVMCGLAYPSTDYIKGMIDWCRQHRGYKADGSVNLCWDVINYHYYANNGNGSQSGGSTQGAAPELAGTATTAQQFINVAHQYAGDMPVWVTEQGYDVNQGSPLKAPPIGNKTALQTQADWELRSALLYARQGVARTFFYEMYDDNPTSSIQFGSSGLVNTNQTRKPTADYFYQVNQIFGQYTYQSTISTNPLVDVYTLNGQQAYVLTVPDQKGRTAAYTLSLSTADSARIYTPKAGANQPTLQKVKVNSGKLSLTVTETPQFVIPYGTAKTTLAKTTKVFYTDSLNRPLTDSSAIRFNVYPNPTTNFVNISFNPLNKTKVDISVSDASSGKIYRHVSGYADTGSEYAQMVSMSGMPNGVYLIAVKQGNSITVKKVIKIGS